MAESATIPESLPTHAETRHRLLEAAGEVFAEHGFHRATVRDICSRAGANVAAVNYHFRDKEGLYAAVLQHWMGVALSKYPPDMGVPAGATAEQRLGAFVRSFVFRVMGQGTPAWHGRLMIREMHEPTAALDQLVQSTMRPLAGMLEAIVRDLLGPAASADALTVRHCCFSVVGQCCFYRHAEAAISKLFPQQTYSTEDLERIADHITRFSLAGVKSFVPKEAGATPPAAAATGRQRELDRGEEARTL